MKIVAHPLWLVGFRPFFALACLAGLSLPLWWVLVYTGAVPPAPTFVGPLQWHAHEMFYGFGWAALGGFLLTASKNWVGVRGWHGGALILLAAAWVFDRIAMSLGAGWPPELFWLAHGLFQAAIVAMLLWTLFVQRVRENNSDNYFFWIILPLFLPAKFLIVQGDYFALGWSMTLALFRVAFLIMLERTQVQFMRGAFKVDILRNPHLDLAIKWLAVILVFGQLLPAILTGTLEFVLALLLLGRFVGWYPRKAFTRLDIGIMYLGYLAIVTQLLINAIGQFVDLPWVGSVSAHVFTVGVMGLILPAMIVRISKGHTGRNVVFERADKLVLWIMLGGFVARVVAPQFYPAGYTMWLHLASVCWLVAFGLLLWRYLPFLLTPRVDGKAN
ncbi:MAG: NnrS family protein [Gammaproteobacteria bacterium]|nr:NnrS family protein [Rhodocyclaceae bacterium]MBU3909721.1 NnrS family protein [Gammaproteobacteria bacterium]MBU3990563.1 NnrS family protein [Gammaproteobacteria bacterium]MBU4005254.1 NnrS family protein [Gammaproteobacteria bacterium]MBU4022433.1 NnrS family protein [Gammaproteobacteria bacterium]